MSNTIFMKLVGAIVVGGELVRPPAIVEVSPAEAADLARRGKAVAAVEGDEASARTPSAENITGGAPGADENPNGAAESDSSESAPDVVEGDGSGEQLPPASDTESQGEAVAPAESTEAPAAGRRRRS